MDSANKKERKRKILFPVGEEIYHVDQSKKNYMAICRIWLFSKRRKFWADGRERENNTNSEF